MVVLRDVVLRGCVASWSRVETLKIVTESLAVQRPASSVFEYFLGVDIGEVIHQTSLPVGRSISFVSSSLG